MSDPYYVLGISRDATDEEVKKRYKELCRKYHPDLNPGNGAAEEMFKEVQQAYQEIMDARKNGFGQNPFGAGFEGGGTTGGYGEYELHMTAAYRYIQSGHYAEAVNVLDGISQHTAQWFYFYGAANAGMGNNVAARQYAETAVRMEPGNFEYQRFLQSLVNGQEWYQERRQSYQAYPMGANGCANLCLANLCCSCLCPGRICFC